MGNYIKGTITVLLDRFMDTVALITICFFLWIFQRKEIDILLYVLFLFLGTVTLIYMCFPGICHFWRQSLLASKASPRKMLILKWLGILWKVYGEIQNTIRGKGIILYSLSLIAWIIEIGHIAVISERIVQNDVIDYLRSAMVGKFSNHSGNFSLAIVVMSICTYLMVKLVDYLTSGKRRQR